MYQTQESSEAIQEEQKITPTSSTQAVNSTTPPTDPQLNTTAPGQLRVIKRNGTLVPYQDTKISVAITKAFLAVEGATAAASSRVHERVAALTQQISDTFHRRLSTGGTLHIEEVQDQVELALMRAEEHKVARSYVLYREEHRRMREQMNELATREDLHNIEVTLDNGERTPLDYNHLNSLISEACQGLEDVDPLTIQRETLKSLYEGISSKEINSSLLMTTRTLIEQEPNYAFAAARILADKLRAEALSFLDLAPSATQKEMTELYPLAFSSYIHKAAELELLSDELLSFDLKQLGAALRSEADLKFSFLGLQTLYDRYFIHYQDTRIELPQVFFMRVAMGLALNEPTAQRELKAIEFYECLSSFDYMSSTPTLFNSGSLRPQLSSCYLTTVPDDLEGIYGAIKDNALLSKWAGGLGNDWTQVRALGAHIKGTNGRSQGVVPFLKVVNDTAVAVNQGGKRKGAVCAYLETWHLDIEEFIELRKNTGDDRRRTHDMNTANWIPDLFMKRVFEDKPWTLFSPNEVPDLHDLYGNAFESRYEAYEAQAAQGKIKVFKAISAKELWRKILSMLFETGHPWITFKDACNLRSPQQHAGVIHSSNLCTEITLNTSDEEIAVCNLGSINLAQHLKEIDGKQVLDQEKVAKTVRTAIRMLDNVIDINYYAVPQARRSNLKHRPIGLGVMGFQDALYLQSIPYGSEDAVAFADQSAELISYYAIQASCELAKERGSYASYEGSLWSRGILPIDSIALLKQSRSEAYLDMNLDTQLDWETLRESVKANGMRNSNVMAIAPTATIANICGVSQSIEPTYQNLYVKSNLSGEFTVVNPHLVKAFKAEGIWDNVMVNDLKYYDGSVQNIERVPDSLKTLFANAFEIEPRWLVEAASRRQKWIDQAQSLNLYIKEPNGRKLDITYRMAWLKGLKTTYYLRAMGATATEKSTLHTSQLNAVSNQIEKEPLICSIDNPDCEACQ